MKKAIRKNDTLRNALTMIEKDDQWLFCEELLGIDTDNATKESDRAVCILMDKLEKRIAVQQHNINRQERKAHKSAEKLEMELLNA